MSLRDLLPPGTFDEISKELDEDKLTNKELRVRVNTLNRDYLRFVNNVYFREVTPQDQGIELYDLMQKQMNIKRDEEGLSTEVEQLYHYVTMANDEQRNKETEKKIVESRANRLCISWEDRRRSYFYVRRKE